MQNVMAVALALTLGCATTATVHRTDGSPVEAEIESSDAAALHLRGPSGNIVLLGQYRVASIDHPGNVMALIGGCYAGAGLLTFGSWLLIERSSAAKNGGPNGLSGLVGAAGIAETVIGLAVFVPSLITWERSRARAHAFEAARPPGWLIPPAVPGDAEPIAPIRPPPDGTDDEDPDKKPPTGFHR